MDGEEHGAQQGAADAQGEAQGGRQAAQGAEPTGSADVDLGTTQEESEAVFKNPRIGFVEELGDGRQLD